ncbi:MAG: ABC transporter permease subunit, partial [Ignavibacteria bacterium]|nr:ABC transporter permease subunit [Ignavibacteria bacterium]
MLTLIQIELYKVFKKWRTYIGFLAIGALVIIVETAVYYEGNHFLRNTMRNLQENFILVGNPLNGWFVASMIMNFLWIHIPFLITLVTGDLLAGEGSAGTYRILLSRPISRAQIITAKY